MSQQIYIDTDGIERAISSGIYEGVRELVIAYERHFAEREDAWISKRELFAAMAMQGILGNAHDRAVAWGIGAYAEYSVSCADALLAELAKPQEQEGS